MSDYRADYYAARKHLHDHGDHVHDDHAPVTEHDDGLPSEYEIEEDFPYRGSRVVARAWVDPEFRKRLLEDGRAACAEMGIELEAERLIAVENTPEVHNMIVCTLCSCYPRALLGMPPTWYKSRNYRSRVVFEPRSVLKEFGTILPDTVTVRVHDSNADMRYVVIPMRPAGTEGWTESELADILTRDTLVGVTVPQVRARDA